MLFLSHKIDLCSTVCVLNRLLLSNAINKTLKFQFLGRRLSVQFQTHTLVYTYIHKCMHHTQSIHTHKIVWLLLAFSSILSIYIKPLPSSELSSLPLPAEALPRFAHLAHHNTCILLALSLEHLLTTRSFFTLLVSVVTPDCIFTSEDLEVRATNKREPVLLVFLLLYYITQYNIFYFYSFTCKFCYFIHE